MTLTGLVLLSLVLPGKPPVQYDVQRYVRPAGGKYVLESEILQRKTDDGRHYKSTTHRPGVEMQLAIDFDAMGKVRAASITHKTKAGNAEISATVKGKRVTLKRNGEVVQTLELASAPVLATTAPDWSDILLLLQQYDRKQGGKQAFIGLWFHPVKPAFGKAFTVEKQDAVPVELDGKRISLDKYRVHLRSGAYHVWADVEGVVYRILHSSQKKGGVFLKGTERVLESVQP